MANSKLFIDIVARDKATKALIGLRGGLAKVRGAVFNLQNAFIGLGAGLVIRNLVNTGKEIENLRTRLKFLLKDTNEGAKAFENMSAFASKVPFSLEEISRGSGILATITDNANDLQKMLEITGNVAAVTGLDFRTTAEQIQRSFSAGIGAADLFREKGVRNMLGFQAGATVSIEATAEAFEKVFGKGGRFGNATDELAKTFEGTMSMLGDKVFSFKKTLLDAGFFGQLKTEFGALDKFLVKNAESIERVAIGFGTLLAKAVKGIADLFVLLKDNIGAVVTAFKILIAIKIVAFMVSLGKAIVPVLAGLRGLAALSGVGLALVAASVAATTATFFKLNKEIDKTLKSLSDVVDSNINFQELISSADANDGFAEMTKQLEEVDGFLYNASSELGIRIPTATEKAIKKFKELNNGVLEDIKKKKENIRMIIAEGINDGITTMSQALSKSLVFGEKLSDTLRNMALNVLGKIVSTLIEQIVRQQIQIAMENKQIAQLITKLGIEKMITKERIAQSTISGGNGSMGSSLVNFASSFFRASGGSVQKGQPYMVGEQGAELFVPNQSGQIQQSARGTGNGGSTTVNFNINTVDASGFEELLVRSRGTITQLINSAVNERGSRNLI
jgi:hypothetical protein